MSSTKINQAYTTDENAYEIFIGNITPQEFVKPFDQDVSLAIDNLLDNWVWDEPIPAWLASALYRYVADAIDLG
jgi:hypothetical protein